MTTVGLGIFCLTLLRYIWMNFNHSVSFVDRLMHSYVIAKHRLQKNLKHFGAQLSKITYKLLRHILRKLSTSIFWIYVYQLRWHKREGIGLYPNTLEILFLYFKVFTINLWLVLILFLISDHKIRRWMAFLFFFRIDM